MATYYKATRPDGTDFHTGLVDYAGALASGEPVTHPGGVRSATGDAATYLSVSTTSSDCTGFRWPCRLFAVEPVDPWTPHATDLPNKRACLSLRVVEELPAWQVFGPNGERVVAVIDRASRLTADEIERLGAAWIAAWDAAWDAAWAAAWAAAGDAARAAAWASIAETVRDLITPEQYELLAGPWNTVIADGE